MAKKIYYEEAIALFRAKYGDFFGYELVKDNYKDFSTKVPIICPIHGIFHLSPSRHLNYPHGCPCCGHAEGGKLISGKKKTRKMLFGVGINDDKEIHSKKHESIAYRKWRTMLARCYSKSYHQKQKTYMGCSVCTDWLTFSNFKRWHEANYKDGYELDKDLLVKGNKVYSPNTCCYVPKEINSLLLSCKSARGSLPIGVIEHKTPKKVMYVAQSSTSLFGKRENNYLGSYDTPKEAFLAYKKFKEIYIKEVANSYFTQGKITKEVYKALTNYEISITD